MCILSGEGFDLERRYGLMCVVGVKEVMDSEGVVIEFFVRGRMVNIWELLEFYVFL